MRAFVTGGTGFLGSHLVESLVDQGDEVCCLVRESSDRTYLSTVADRLTWAMAPIVGERDPALTQALEASQVVYHIAGATKKTGTDRAGLFAVNEAGTRNLIEASIEAGLERFVLLSSVAAVGPSEPGRATKETRPPAPVSDYGASKLAGERVCLEYADQIEVVILRPPAIYGPRDRALLPLVSMVKKRLRPAGQRRVNFIHVRDVVGALLVAGRHEAARGEIFHVGARDISLDELGKAFTQCLNLKALPVSIPAFVYFSLAKGGDTLSKIIGRKNTLIDREKAREYTASWSIDSSKAADMLDWQAQTSFGEGLTETLAWYRQAGWI